MYFLILSLHRCRQLLDCWHEIAFQWVKIYLGTLLQWIWRTYYYYKRAYSSKIVYKSWKYHWVQPNSIPEVSMLFCFHPAFLCRLSILLTSVQLLTISHAIMSLGDYNINFKGWRNLFLRNFLLLIKTNNNSNIWLCEITASVGVNKYNLKSFRQRSNTPHPYTIHTFILNIQDMKVIEWPPPPHTHTHTPDSETS